MSNKILTILLNFIPLFAYGQQDSLAKLRYPLWRRELTNTLLIGANHQTYGDTSSTIDGTRWFAELGFHRTFISSSRHGPSTFTYGFSTLASADKNNKIIGFRVGAWTSYLLSLGLYMTYYTNFKQGNFKITPEMGIGMGSFKLGVGYNIPTFANKDFTALQYADMQVTINYLFKIKTIHSQMGPSGK